MSTSSLPLVAITLGDPAGTGPEIITKALAVPDLRTVCRPVVIGDARTLQRALEFTGVQLQVTPVDDVAQTSGDSGRIEVLDLKNVDPAAVPLGRVSPAAGKAAYEYVRTAAELALQRRVGAIVTSAINKEALNQAGYHYDGHTGLLAELCHAPDATMMLAADKLRVSHVSTHVPLRVAIDRVQPQRILNVIRLTRDAVARLGIANPRIAVAGLNPHAGEHGLFGDEEERLIAPAIRSAQEQGIAASGPYPGDTVFFRTMQGEFDAAVAMYHDQGHVAVKMLGIWRGVNITLGLPIIRTSVEHGTNFDMAGTGRSDPRSLLEATRLAAALARAT
ncbi:MAG TPA: 4-hydroxythreonine-4-phosphate dehydrogenase PdxA [Opitutaceae bacterium]|nr:4-hydroxythreonine-4-phosphate dehydrogenase PdxA [Opitutaceae bacterium]